jgi:hypothetical protein
MSKKKKSGARTNSGQLSRAKKAIYHETDPARLVRMRDAALTSISNPLWGTQIGQMHLRGEINAVQLSAGQKWFMLLAAYHQAIGARSIAPQSLEIGRGSSEPDTETERGRKLAEREQAITAEYDKVLRSIGSGTERDKALRRLADDKALDFYERRQAICGLDVLAGVYGLTNNRICA